MAIAGKQEVATEMDIGEGWKRIAETTAFSIRDTSEDLVYKGRMWLSNGYYYDNVTSRDLWSSKDGVNWQLVNAHTPYDSYSEMVVYRSKMWAIKGSVWTSTDGLNWKKVSAATPFGVRGYGEAVVHKGKIWQLGSGDDVWNTQDGVQWTCTASEAPFGKRYASAVTAYKGKLWLMGGSVPYTTGVPEKHYKQYTTLNDVWNSADGVHWTRVMEHAPWAERQWFIAKVYAGRLWIIGGFDNRNSKNFDDVWYTEDGKNWHEYQSPEKFSPRHEPTCYIFRDSLWVVAGNSWPLMNDVWRLTLPDQGFISAQSQDSGVNQN